VEKFYVVTFKQDVVIRGRYFKKGMLLPLEHEYSSYDHECYDFVFCWEDGDMYFVDEEFLGTYCERKEMGLYEYMMEYHKFMMSAC
jgi:hypothetical protein